ncbi:MAG: hypothetical protein JST88_09800 [Bacteroidetes bacterium]|nr:hypothetical protein [Bacteroidota bacterium]
MKLGYSIILFAVMATTIFISCKKWTDPAAPKDPRLNDHRYCNDPLAVNYNWNFPGVADNTVCIYPSDLFKGTYSFTDSVYDNQQNLDTINPRKTYLLYFLPVTKYQFRVVGFCGVFDSLKFTAERSTYRANADTTIFQFDTIKVYGQYFCRQLDTLTGYFQKNKNDSTLMTVQFRVVSDTGTFFHKGTAVKN